MHLQCCAHALKIPSQLPMEYVDCVMLASFICTEGTTCFVSDCANTTNDLTMSKDQSASHRQSKLPQSCTPGFKSFASSRIKSSDLSI